MHAPYCDNNLSGKAGIILVIRDLPNIFHVNCDLHIFIYVKRDWG